MSTRQSQHDDNFRPLYRALRLRATLGACAVVLEQSQHEDNLRPPHRSFFIHTLGRQQGRDRKLLKSSQESSQASISNMYSIKTSAILFIYFSVFAFETVFAAENGYIIKEEISCEEQTASIVSESCSDSIGYKVFNISKIPIGKSMQSLLSVANSIIPNATSTLEKLGNQQCSEAGKKYLCEAAHPLRCEEEYIRIDTKEMTATCSQARVSCSAMNATSRDQFFNCSKIVNDYGIMPKTPRKLTCLDFPALKGDPYTCDANYKVS